MRLLYTVNVSNGDRLGADSGLIFGQLVVEALQASGHVVATHGPAPLPGFESIHLASSPLATKYAARFGTSYAALLEAIRRFQPTHLLVNQAETVPQVRAALAEVQSNTRVVTYCHYVPFHQEGSSVVDCVSLADSGFRHAVRLAFLSGLQASDAVCVHSGVAAEWIRAGAAQHAIDIPPIHIIPPPYDPAFVGVRPSQRPERRIIYNHRLYAHYGAADFVRLAQRLISAAGVEIVVLDVLGPRSAARRRLDPFPTAIRETIAAIEGCTVVTPSTRDEYREYVRSSALCLAPSRRNCTWSMSCVDAQGLGVPVFAPDYAWFREHIPRRLRFRSHEEAEGVVLRCLDDDAFMARAAEDAIGATKHLEPRVVSAQLERVLSDAAA